MTLVRFPRSFRFRVLAATSLVVGTAGTIIDSSRQNDCADSMTWLGYVGWALVAGGTLASFGPAVVGLVLHGPRHCGKDPREAGGAVGGRDERNAVAAAAFQLFQHLDTIFT